MVMAPRWSDCWLLAYLCKSHPIPLVGGLLCARRVHQLETSFVLLVEISILTSTAKLRGVLICRQRQ